MPNTLEDLREHLFATLQDLRAKENPMDVARARAVSEIAKTVIDSARAEVEYLKASGQDAATLPVFQSKDAAPALPGVRTHRIK